MLSHDKNSPLLHSSREKDSESESERTVVVSPVASLAKQDTTKEGSVRSDHRHYANDSKLVQRFINTHQKHSPAEPRNLHKLDTWSCNSVECNRSSDKLSKPHLSNQLANFDSTERSAIQRTFPLRRSSDLKKVIPPLSSSFVPASTASIESGKGTVNPDNANTKPPNPNMGGKNRKSIWATIPAAPPRRPASDNWASDVASDEVDNGGGNVFGEKSSKVHPDILRDGSQLADWQGQWAPAPVDWDQRPVFVNRLIIDRMHEWSQRSDLEPYVVELANQGLNEIEGQIAPRKWLPEDIDGLKPALWWAAHFRSPEVEIEDGCEPWWKTYAAKNVDVLMPVSVPDARLDMNDNDPKDISKTAGLSMISWDNRLLRRVDDSRKSRERRVIEAKEAAQWVKPSNPHAPRINIYLRPASAHDMVQITQIYSHYIQQTIFSPELSPLTTSQVRDRWNDINEARLPFLVAVDKSSKGNKKTRQKNTKTQDEHILGFAFADDYNDIRGMYRYTVEIEVFVKPDYLRNGIGRCLLDKLIVVLDPLYIERGGYDFISDDVAYCAGGKRVIGSMVANIPHDSADNAKIEWIQKWLTSWKFEQCGHFPEVGHKLSTM